jgi:hypothetical protein
MKEEEDESKRKKRGFYKHSLPIEEYTRKKKRQ